MQNLISLTLVSSAVLPLLYSLLSLQLSISHFLSLFSALDGRYDMHSCLHWPGDCEAYKYA